VAQLELDIEQITGTLWGSLFDLPLQPAEPAELGSEVVTGCVQIVGGWQGAVMLRCPMPLAETLTAHMFQDECAPTLDEVRDALGELTNVIGGNVKALFPGPSRISLPTVVVGSDYQLSVVDSGSVTSVGFECDGQPLVVTLYERPEDGEEGE
jgi:chemotaxis protein CheX